MRCLYCGKELALLKRWTRGGQFCSEAHKVSYQEEYNRIGLSRLLQAQSKAVQAKASQQQEASGSKAPGPVSEAPVAVEEAPAEEAQKVDGALEEVVEVRTEETAEEVVPEPEEEAAWEPAELAGFVREETAPAAVSLDIPPYSEPWEPASPAPVVPAWQSAGALNRDLPFAPILELKFRPNLADSEHSVPEVKVTPSEFVPAKAHPPALAAILASNKLPSAGLVKQTVAPRAPESSAVASVDRRLDFSIEAAYRESSLLQPACTQIAFPREDADVALEQGNADGALWPSTIEETNLQPASASTDVAAEELPENIVLEQEAIEPSAAAEGLIQLHRELTQTEEETPAAASSQQDSQAGYDRENEETVLEESEPEAVASSEDTQSEEQAKPRSAGQPVEIPVKIFAPLKPSPKEGAGALIKLPVFLPGLTGLPLRPKMGLVPSAAGPGTKKTAQRPAAPGTTPASEAKPTTEAKPVTESKPAAEAKVAADAQSKEEAGTRGPAPIATKPWGKAMPRTPQAQSPATPVKAQPTVPPSKAAPTGKTAGTPPAKAREDGKSSTKVPAPSGIVEKIPAPPPASTAETSQHESISMEIEAPNFGSAQDGSASWMGSLKGKLAIGAAAIVVCVAGYVIFGGKPQTPVANTTAAAADKAGPSIMVGGGGWVEGWAGDPAGAHSGRQITVYRPSLKLSDYRIEFKGEIESKSLGWVFRATDPEDYYAMKLAIVTPGLEPKIALVKSLVSHGRETQIGKVPINLNVRLDTLYTVRVDVRGSKFTTYVQGQQVDTWSDDQLKSGGVGFLNEREERGRIKSVSVSLLNGGKQ
jgi:hypothetical protein